MTTSKRLRRGKTFTVGVATLVIAASGALVASAVTPPPAHQNKTVGLKQVGPIDEANGYPIWYKDTSNVKLELCLDPADPYCIMGELPDPTKPVSFPDNFPDEAFWSSAESTIDAGGGDTAHLVTAVEAAFGSADGLPAKGQQISFGRMRIRAGGLVDNAEYKITHPYGVETAVAEVGAVKGVNTTEDIGSLSPDGVFDQTLGSRPAPFLKWTGTDAPAGYLGDPTVDHAVTGSPYNTNFFRMEGPAGSFTGSTQLCGDPALGSSPTATDDCIQSNDFAVQGKLATRMGVQATTAYYANSGSGHMMDLFAKSEPGQVIVVKGTGIAQTKMREDASQPGRYYTRVYADGAPPPDLSVTNTTDTPDTVDHVDLSMFGDKVHIGSAVYSNDARTLTVSAQSGDDSAALSLDGFPNVAPTVANGVTTWTVPKLEVPPADVIVTSNNGGVDTEDAVITGAEDPSVGVVATIRADSNTVQIGQTVTLDGLASTGTVTGYAWSVSPDGATLTGTVPESRTFKATAAGTYTVALTVNGKSNSSTDRYTIEVLSSNADPVADAGPDQPGVVPTSTVTLDGTKSTFASTFSWAQDPADKVQLGANLKNPTTANPTFVVPASSAPLTFNFTLTIKDVNGTASTDTVQVVTDPGAVTVASAFYKRGDLQWRVAGSAKYCSANNLVSVYWNKPVTGGTTPVLIGTTTPTLTLGVCDFEFRVKNVAAALRPTAAGTITVRSAYGGEALDRPFQFL
jgi:hypothetical protein